MLCLCSVMVITLDPDSSNLGSIPSEGFGSVVLSGGGG